MLTVLAVGLLQYYLIIDIPIRKRTAMPSHSNWLIDEKRPLTERNEKQLDRELSSMGSATRGGSWMPRLAISLHDIIVLDNRKWFGGADIRVDALVVTGYGNSKASDSYYVPKTASFPRVADGDRLPIGDGGLLVFHGLAEHFVDLSVMVSRDRKDSDSLAGLLKTVLKSDAAAGIATSLTALAGVSPQVDVDTVKGALAGATALGDLAYQLLRRATGDTIGLYRNAHLKLRDGFGIGAHPGPGKATYNVNDLAFRYEIDEE